MVSSGEESPGVARNGKEWQGTDRASADKNCRQLLVFVETEQKTRMKIIHIIIIYET